MNVEKIKQGKQVSSCNQTVNTKVIGEKTVANAATVPEMEQQVVANDAKNSTTAEHVNHEACDEYAEFGLSELGDLDAIAHFVFPNLANDDVEPLGHVQHTLDNSDVQAQSGNQGQQGTDQNQQASGPGNYFDLRGQITAEASTLPIVGSSAHNPRKRAHIDDAELVTHRAFKRGGRTKQRSWAPGKVTSGVMAGPVDPLLTSYVANQGCFTLEDDSALPSQECFLAAVMYIRSSSHITNPGMVTCPETDTTFPMWADQMIPVVLMIRAAIVKFDPVNSVPLTDAEVHMALSEKACMEMNNSTIAYMAWHVAVSHISFSFFLSFSLSLSLSLSVSLRSLYL